MGGGAWFEASLECSTPFVNVGIASEMGFRIINLLDEMSYGNEQSGLRRERQGPGPDGAAVAQR